MVFLSLFGNTLLIFVYLILYRPIKLTEGTSLNQTIRYVYKVCGIQLINEGRMPSD